MPIERHTRLTLKGDFMGTTAPVEIWQFGLKYETPGTGEGRSLADLQTAANAVPAVWTEHLAPLHHPRIRLRGVRVSEHVEGGLTRQTSDGSFAQADWVGLLNASAGTATMYPLQVAGVVSLMTPRAGSSGRGRVFLPQLRFPMGDQWRYATAAVDEVAVAFAGFLADLEPIVGAAQVFSYKGFHSPVSAVRVGDVPDTQRSRREQMDEAYRVVTL
jgi:hypothetical protein